MHWLQAALWSAAGIAIGLALALPTMRHLRWSKRLRTAAAFAAALLSSFAYFDTRDRAAIEETEGETKRKKDDQSGDPPKTGQE
jgi:hypothetical protein